MQHAVTHDQGDSETNRMAKAQSARRELNADARPRLAERLRAGVLQQAFLTAGGHSERGVGIELRLDRGHIA